MSPKHSPILPAQSGDCFKANCAARSVLLHVSSRWGSLIIAALQAQGTMRFSELRKRIEGISEKMLAQKLRELERDGLLIRRAYDIIPPHVEYRLSTNGKGIAEHIQSLVQWVNGKAPSIYAARMKYDERQNE